MQEERMLPMKLTQTDIDKLLDDEWAYRDLPSVEEVYERLMKAGHHELAERLLKEKRYEKKIS